MFTKTTPPPKRRADEEPEITISGPGVDKFSLVDATLLKRRMIHLIDPITDVTFEQFKNAFDELLEVNPAEPVHIVVGTVGGDVRSMLGIMNLILLSKTPCYTYLLGETCSAGSWIYLCGHKRFAANTTLISFMLHPMESTKSDNFGNQISHVKYLDKLTNNLVEFTAKQTGMSKETLIKLFTSETYYFVGQEIFDNNIATDKLSSSSFWVTEPKNNSKPIKKTTKHKATV